MSTLPSDPKVAPAYLFGMPIRTLRGEARGIEAWCKSEEVQRPTLLHLALAREARSGEPR